MVREVYLRTGRITGCDIASWKTDRTKDKQVRRGTLVRRGEPDGGRYVVLMINGFPHHGIATLRTSLEPVWNMEGYDTRCADEWPGTKPSPTVPCSHAGWNNTLKPAPKSKSNIGRRVSLSIIISSTRKYSSNPRDIRLALERLVIFQHMHDSRRSWRTS
jgi:hypothetical protein